jgi:cell division protein FtsB
VFAVIVFCGLLAGLTLQYTSLGNLQNSESQLQTEFNTLVEIRENYEAEYDYIYNNQAEYVEDYVREVLGWGREGELKFTPSN